MTINRFTCTAVAIVLFSPWSLSAQTPGHNDWYWESRVNLLIDNSGRGPTGKDYTAAQLTEMMRDIPVSMIMVQVLGNSGMISYPSQMLPNTGGSFDTPGTWKQVAANLGKEFGLYMNSLALEAYKEHPEWMRRRADGSGYPQRVYTVCA